MFAIAQTLCTRARKLPLSVATWFHAVQSGSSAATECASWSEAIFNFSGDSYHERR